MTRPLATIVVGLVVLTWTASFFLAGKPLDATFVKPIHYGATRRAVSGAPRNPEKLTGSYWTARTPVKTSGEMVFRFATRKAVHSFEEGMAAAHLDAQC